MSEWIDLRFKKNLNMCIVRKIGWRWDSNRIVENAAEEVMMREGENTEIAEFLVCLMNYVSCYSSMHT